MKSAAWDRFEFNWNVEVQIRSGEASRVTEATVFRLRRRAGDSRYVLFWGKPSSGGANVLNSGDNMEFHRSHAGVSRLSSDVVRR